MLKVIIPQYTSTFLGGRGRYEKTCVGNGKIISQEGETSRGQHLAPILKTQTFPIYLLLCSCPCKYELRAN